MTLHQLATLVKQLRTAQRANGTGYKTPAATSTIGALEKKVDAAVEKALETWPRDMFESIDT